MFHNGVTLKGKLIAVLKDKDGNEKQRVEKENLIVNGGKDGIVEQLLNDPDIAVPSHMGLGEGSTGPEVSDTDLEDEKGSRKELTKERELNEIEMFAVFGPDEPISETMEITEAGIFNDATSGDLWARITFGVVTKEPEDTFDVTWTWQVKNANS